MKGRKGFFERYQWQMLAAILLMAFIMAIAFLKGVSVYGDDDGYISLVQPILSGTFKETSFIFSVRLLMIVPLAISTYLFGYNNYGAGGYAIFCYIVSTAITFFIAKKIYGSKTGLLSAFLFAIFPMSVKYSSTADVVMPTALYVGLALLFFVYAKYSDAKRGSRAWLYALSGIAAFAATLVDPIAYVAIVAFFAYIVLSMMVEAFKKKSLRLDYTPLVFLLGIFTAVAILGFVNIAVSAPAEPFYEFNITNSFYSTTGTPNTIFYIDTDLLFYVDNVFSYNFIGNLVSGHFNLFLGSVENLFSINNVNANDFGIFAYAILPFALYLTFKKDKKSYMLLAYSAVSVLYLEFGSMSLSHYFLMYRLVRFLVIATIPFMIILARGIVMFVESRRHGAKYRQFAAIAIIALLFATSLPIDYFLYALNHNSLLYSWLIAKSLENAPNMSTAYVYAPDLLSSFIQYYTGFKQTNGYLFYNNGNYFGTFMPRCSDIPKNSYIVIPSSFALSIINNNSTWPVANPWYINESWAYNPALCNLTLYADIYNNSEVRNAQIVDLAYSGNLYYNK